jgi:signal transduction histidine kinase
VVLGTLLLFAVLVVVIHVVAVRGVGRTVRLQELRLVSQAAERQLDEGRVPDLPDSSGYAVISGTGAVLAGALPPYLRWHPPARWEPGEQCRGRGGPCWVVRARPASDDDARRLVVYHRGVPSPEVLGSVSFALLGSVVAWVAVSAAAGLFLLRALREADQSRRLLLAGLAHDLGTPLTSIRGFAETRLAGGAGDERDRRTWTVVYREAVRMQRLIEDMLALSRLEAGRFAVVPRAFDLREAVLAAAERATLALGAGPAVDVPAAPAFAAADRDRVDQILANLVDNAYRHGGGRNVRIALRPAGGPGRWLLEVEDDGPGLSPAARAHLYEPFRPGGAGRGSGLGLAIVREIVGRHGGVIRVADGPGCRVSVELPAAAPAPEPGAGA